MPEYLAPGVYVEEIDTGSKPIEGVSTSTAGMVGVTERGPVNVPTLVTSMGEYRRIFGERLNPNEYFNPGPPADRSMHFLPHAIEGFFTNGGKRVFVTRVLDVGAAQPATRTLVAPDPGAPLTSLLASGAAANVTPPIMTVIDDPGFAVGNTVQIDDGVAAEFRSVTAAAAATTLVSLSLPVGRAHGATAAATVVELITVVPAAAPDVYNRILAAPVVAGRRDINVDNAAAPAGNNPIVAGNLLAVDVGAQQELVYVDGPPTGNTITLRTPLQLAHASGVAVVRQTPTVAGPAAPPRTLNRAAAPGDTLVEVNDTTGLTTPGDFIQFRDPTAAGLTEVRNIGALQRVTITPAPTVGQLGGAAYGVYRTGSRVERVTLPAASILAITLTETATRGSTTVRVSDRTLFNPGTLLQIGGELVEVVTSPGPLPGANPGPVVLRAPLRRNYTPGTAVVHIPAITASPTVVGSIVSAATADANTLIVSMPVAPATGDHLRITDNGSGPFYHDVVAPVTAVTPRLITLDAPLTLAHVAGASVTVRTPMIRVVALDAGVWGNRVRVAMEPQPEPLLNTAVRAQISNTQLRLNSAAGVEVGTELLLIDALTGTTTVHKVAQLDRQNDFLITVEASTLLPVLGGNVAVRSREYRFVVELLRQEDPANPSRNNQAIDREAFTNLSLDPRHSRYFERVIGTTWNLSNPAITLDDSGRPLRLSDRRSEGESSYVRLRDLETNVALLHGARPGPLPAYETRPDGTQRLILLPLTNGDDQLNQVADVTYIGTDNTNPEQRTGLFTLRNIEEISIVGAPGRTQPQIQGALITHCEFMRYRFAVLDGNPPPNDAMANIQAQRQQFDTKYAALYHPWLIIPDPYPASAGTVPDYPIPPSGHMLGIYARTDIERGVHKAPANEVVRGVIGLQRLLNKEQHDILNPYPVNINVIRDFRNNNRGIRVYGGRVITSDSDWKYVNVRRLLIFIEASIDRGLQWVVFEPNAEPLWARVRRSISNFLTLVWRNGALEGTKTEEAYFVKCDRTTMTQTDIDSGRLICVIGVAPVKPAEFVIVRIGLWTAHADDQG